MPWRYFQAESDMGSSWLPKAQASAQRREPESRSYLSEGRWGPKAEVHSWVVAQGQGQLEATRPGLGAELAEGLREPL